MEVEMIEVLPESPPGVIAVRVVGWVLREDFGTVQPLVDEALLSGRGIRALIYVDDSFAGISAGAMLEDLKLGRRAFRHWTGCAIVTPGWLRTSAWLAQWLVPWPVRVFDVSEIDEAFSWLDGLGDTRGHAAHAAAATDEIENQP